MENIASPKLSPVERKIIRFEVMAMVYQGAILRLSDEMREEMRLNRELEDKINRFAVEMELKRKPSEIAYREKALSDAYFESVRRAERITAIKEELEKLNALLRPHLQFMDGLVSEMKRQESVRAKAMKSWQEVEREEVPHGQIH